jgi:hypothetical protein
VTFLPDNNRNVTLDARSRVWTIGRMRTRRSRQEGHGDATASVVLGKTDQTWSSASPGTRNAQRASETIVSRMDRTTEAGGIDVR